MRRSIDDYPATAGDIPPGLEDDLAPVSWAVAISDDYDDAEPRVVLTVEEVGLAGAGMVAHLSPTVARRLRAALADALAEIGERL
jgi:adenine/guanine phosphoribosyltransferase-like PRPP-binding protein